MAHSNHPAGFVRRSGGPSFGMVDVKVVRDRSLPRNVRTVYTYLATYCSVADDPEKGHPARSAYPSRARIGNDTDMSVSAVDIALKIGSDAGLWTIVKRWINESGETVEAIAETGGRHEPTSSLYLLHDLGGGYVAEVGPWNADEGQAARPFRGWLKDWATPGSIAGPGWPSRWSLSRPPN